MTKVKMVKIYQKPLTLENYEGAALLIRRNLTNEINHTESWWVKFPNDEFPVLRTIKN